MTSSFSKIGSAGGGAKSRRPLKVLHVCAQPEFGGGERAILNWMRFSTVEHAAIVGGRGRLGGMLEAAGCRVHELRPWRPRNVFGVLGAAAAVVARERVDVIHAGGYDAQVLGGLLRWRTGRPEVWFNHGPIERDAWSRFSRFIPSDLVLVATQWMKSEQRRTGYVARHLAVQRLGIDHGEFAPDARQRLAMREKHGLRDEVCVAMFARLDPLKGQALLLEAAARVRRRRPALRCKFWFVGGSLADQRALAYADETRARAGALGLAGDTVFWGHTDQVRELMNAADILVQATTIPESFGLALVEGMATEKLCLAPREGGPCEIVTDGTDGLLFTPREPEALAQRLEEALDLLSRAPERAAAMARQARATVVARYDLRASTAALEQWYRWLAGAEVGRAQP
jgi:glycosyltransferase involved in cell wall biosynthesis